MIHELVDRIRQERKRIAAGAGRVLVEDPFDEGIAVLEDYGLELRIINQLEIRGYLYISDLAGVSEREIAIIPMVGMRSVVKIQRALREFFEFQRKGERDYIQY